MTTRPEYMRNHWWWRPGWRAGRRFYTWHLTFGGQQDVQRFAQECRSALAGVGGLDAVPDRWLHLTLQGIGFVGEVERADVDAVVAAAHVWLAGLPAFELTLTGPVVAPEGIHAPVAPDEPVRAVRDAIRSAIADVLAEVPERPEGFSPHVSVAFGNSTGDRPAAAIGRALARAQVAPATARITCAELLVLHRDNRMYEWKSYARVPLG
ncbi:2'-5' RNA ligase family protein [Streptomyces sp. NPDC051569]|uniref:2'-5' RNA ligase family protein n=1 Tax=Streptomyces sp. NPDC051569 TaxID=3365661 RepID=UPI00378B4A18